MATIDEFKAIEMRVGTILSAEKVEGADKLLRLMVDFGPRSKPAVQIQGESASQEDAPAAREEETPPEDREIRQILSGIAQWYAPEDLVGKQCPFVTNLAPRIIRGLESNGMILAVGVGETAVLLHPDKSIEPGSSLR
jgi:tRNA-binding EMAP/Myf-like protein